MKKPPSKVAHNQPPTFFLHNGPAVQTAQKQKSRSTKSPLMQDWVFRLGIIRNLKKKQMIEISIVRRCNGKKADVLGLSIRELAHDRTFIWKYACATEISTFYN